MGKLGGVGARPGRKFSRGCGPLPSLANGQFVSGLVLREEGEVIVIADGQGKEQRVPKASVDERLVSQVSPMPSNFAEQIGEAELHQLLAYLLAQRAKE